MADCSNYTISLFNKSQKTEIREVQLPEPPGLLSFGPVAFIEAPGKLIM